MSARKPPLFYRSTLLLSFFLFSLFFIINNNTYSLSINEVNGGGNVDPKWACGLLNSGLSCADANPADDTHTSSPALADINKDGILDIVTATRYGRVIAIEDNGGSPEKIFTVDVAPHFGLAAGQQIIRSSPAIGDIDNDGFMEIVIGAGHADDSQCYRGGVIVLEHTGAVKSGWPQFTSAHSVPPFDCPDPVFSTPALGDLDKDGDLEIVAASFDKRIYAWHHNGTSLEGFPPSSKHYARFGWDNISDRLADTIWSSPTLADFTGDGYLDIIQGTDEGNFDDDHWPGSSGIDWTCPYAIPPQNAFFPGYCGGTVYGLDRNGDFLPGFPLQTYEIMQSTPALFDMDNDGRAEIFTGGGTWYNRFSADHPISGFRIWGWDGDGNELPGWEGGKVVGGSTPASPVAGDIDGDGDKEIVALSTDRKVYAWHHTGTAVSGFPMTPVNPFSNDSSHNVGKSLALADYDDNGDMELFINVGHYVVIVDGDGDQVTSTQPNSNPNGPIYYTAWQMPSGESLVNTPAVGDIDGDGKLELVVSASNVIVWDIASSGSADWPMWHHNAERTNFASETNLSVTTSSITKMIADESVGADVSAIIGIMNPGPGELDWTSSASQPGKVTVSPNAGTVGDETDLTTITMETNGLGLGTHSLGTVTIDGGDVLGSPHVISLTIIVVDELNELYLPYVQR